MSQESRGYQPDWDIDLPYGESQEHWAKEIALNPKHAEVKGDRKFPKTGNLYVEYECRGRDGIWRPSGLATTKAEVWVHILGDTGVALVMGTEKLKEICRHLLRLGRKAEEKDGSNPTKGVKVNIVDLVAGLSPVALAGAKRRQERLAKGSECTCVSCNARPVRMWPVPDDLRERYGSAAPYCQLCEPFEGQPLTDWIPPVRRVA